MPNPEPNYVHPRSAVAVRRAGARLSAVDPQNPPHTYGPSGVVPSPKAARGIIVYIGLDESKAAADGTNLSAIAGELQAYAKELASQAETQAVIALAPEGRGSDIDAVRAVANGSPAASGTPAGTHGPVRSRIPNRIHPPALRDDAAAGGYGAHPGEAFGEKAAERLRIDIPRREVRIDGVLVGVTTKEFDPAARRPHRRRVVGLGGTGRAHRRRPHPPAPAPPRRALLGHPHDEGCRLPVRHAPRRHRVVGDRAPVIRVAPPTQEGVRLRGYAR